MKHLIPALVIALATMGSTAHSEDVATDEQTIRSLEQTWLHATATGDKEAMATLLDDEYLERAPNGGVRTKSDVLRAPPPSAESMQELQILRVTLHGDTAVVLGTNQYRSAPSAPSADFMYMDVFQRRAGQWRVIASQISPQPKD